LGFAEGPATGDVVEDGVVGVLEAGVVGVLEAGVVGVLEAGVLGIDDDGVLGIDDDGVLGVDDDGVLGVSDDGMLGVAAVGAESLPAAEPDPSERSPRAMLHPVSKPNSREMARPKAAMLRREKLIGMVSGLRSSPIATQRLCR
jgi:hypothetical protein